MRQIIVTIQAYDSFHGQKKTAFAIQFGSVDSPAVSPDCDKIEKNLFTAFQDTLNKFYERLMSANTAKSQILGPDGVGLNGEEKKNGNNNKPH